MPCSDQWLYELKLDGYRAIAFKRQGTLHLRSRNNKDFSTRYPGVVTALATLPDDTAIDGEIVASWIIRAATRSASDRSRQSWSADAASRSRTSL